MCDVLNVKTACRKKTCHPTFVHNFDKCWAISKTLSLLKSARNLQHYWHNISAANDALLQAMLHTRHTFSSLAL